MLRVISIRYKLIFGGIAAVLIPLTITGIIVYIQLSQSLLDITKQESVHIAQDISGTIDRILKQEVELASAIAADPDIVENSQTGDYRKTQRKLAAIHRRLQRPYATIFVADRQGIARAEAFFTRKIGLDISNRDYLKSAQEGKASISGPFFPLGGPPADSTIIVISVPIQEPGQFLGLVAMAFNTEFLQELLLKKKSGQTGYAFLMNKDGLVLVHPNRAYNSTYHFLDQPGMERIRNLLVSRKVGAVEFRLDGVDKIIGLSREGGTDWVAAFVQDKDEILRPVRKILYSTGVGVAVFLILTALIITVFSSKISHPIHLSLEIVKQMTRHSNEIIIQAGPDGKIVFVNPAFEKITGFKSQEVIGLGLDINTEVQYPKKEIWDSLQKGAPWFGRVTVKGAASQDITLEATILLLRNDRGAVQGYLEIGRDITSEIMFEKRLQQTQKMEALGTLAGGIAHDFNNILAGIFGFAELSLIEKNNPDRIESYVREIIIASERARDLVSQILTFSRKTEVRARPLLPKSVLNEVLKLLKATVPAHIDIQTKIDSDCSIMADPIQLHQMVMNLATNGVHAIGDDQGVIRLELEDFTVDDAFTQTHPNISPGPHVIIRVVDTGCGMDTETLEHVFEPFFTTKAQGKGTGLGLSMVHGIVNQLNGIVTVYSELGHGSSFNIILPCTQADESDLTDTESYIREGTERILVLDDEKAITVSMETILSSLGYRVTVFTDSQEALITLLSHPQDFDLLLTDYSMPHLNGLDIVRNMKEAGIDLPVILSSGFLGNNIEEEANELGVSAIISKPITTYQLTNAIQKVLKHRA